MYPFRTDETFVRNSWYVGCAVDEIAEGPLERNILGEPVVFYRSETGEPLALYGLCPHRGYPLALRGTVHGCAIRCAYHGFAFDGRSGACVSVPSQLKPPTQHLLKTYKVVERGPWIWIWPGDQSLADTSLIPTMDEVGFGDGWKYIDAIRFVDVNARYMFLVENLMDLTHLGYLHGDMGDFDLYVQAPMTIDEREDRVIVERPMQSAWTQQHDVMFKPEHRFDGISEFSSITTFYNPGYVTTTSHITRSIEGFDTVDLSIYGHVHFHHAVTPATANTAHYFGTSSRTHRLDDLEFDRLFTEFDTAVRQQDVDAAEAIEERMIRFGEPEVELLVKGDTAAGRIRRRIQRQIDFEQKRKSTDTRISVGNG